MNGLISLRVQSLVKARDAVSFHKEELDLACVSERNLPFEELSQEQLKLIMDRGRNI